MTDATPFIEDFVERDGASIRFVCWGDPAAPGVPLLALHGLSSNALFWSRTAARLPGRRIIAIDQRGHGRTGDAPSYKPEDFVADAAAVLDRCRIRSVAVMGHSWGSSVALAFAANRPERSAALIFADGGLWRAQASIGDRQTFMIRAQPPFARWPTIHGSVEEKRGELGQAWGDDLVPFAHNGVTRHADGWGCVLTEESRRAILESFWELTADRLWPRLRIPVLIAVASHKTPQMLDRTRLSLERVTAVTPHADVRWYASPHDIPLYLPDRYAADVRAVLECVDAAAR